MRAEQVANYQRLGGLRGRLHQLTAAALLMVAWMLAGLMFDTVGSVYKGTGALRTTEENVVQAEVLDCQQVGPLSANGLGYWSECRISIRRDEGPPVKALVRRSIVTVDDVGQRITLRVWCAKDRDACRYGRPSHRVWAYAVGILSMIRAAVSILLAVGVTVYLLRGILGVPFYFALLARIQRKWAGI